jgi:hypothetical protein
VGPFVKFIENEKWENNNFVGKFYYSSVIKNLPLAMIDVIF